MKLNLIQAKNSLWPYNFSNRSKTGDWTCKNAGLNVNRGIITNDFMQTNDPDIFAGGDNVEVKSFINNENVLIPLAGPANRQGRIIADNILGKNSKYKKSQGTSVIKFLIIQ